MEQSEFLYLKIITAMSIKDLDERKKVINDTSITTLQHLYELGFYFCPKCISPTKNSYLKSFSCCLTCYREKSKRH
jgi:hypothetical protein